MDGFGSLGLDCRAANNYYDVFPLGWINVAWQSCEYYFHDFSWVAITFLSLGIASLAACGVFVLVIKKLATAGFLVGLVLAVLCAIGCVPYLLLVGSGFRGISRLTVSSLLLFLAVPVILVTIVRSGRLGLIRAWRILLILAMAWILVGYPSLDVVYTYNDCGPGWADCPWAQPSLHFFVMVYVFQDIGNFVLFPALLVLAFAPRDVASVEGIPREDARSVWYAVLGFLIPVVGLIGWIAWRKPMPLRAKSIGIGALVAAILWAIVVSVYVIVTHHPSMDMTY